MIFKAKAVIAVAVAGGLVLSGWMTRGWYEDSKDLATKHAQEILAGMLRKDLNGIAKSVEDKLQDLRANETVIDRGIIREIREPVFQNVCIPPDSDSFRMLNSIANGEYAPEPADKGSGAATDPD